MCLNFTASHYISFVTHSYLHGPQHHKPKNPAVVRLDCRHRERSQQAGTRQLAQSHTLSPVPCNLTTPLPPPPDAQASSCQSRPGLSVPKSQVHYHPSAVHCSSYCPLPKKSPHRIAHPANRSRSRPDAPTLPLPIAKHVAVAHAPCFYTIFHLHGFLLLPFDDWPFLISCAPRSPQASPKPRSSHRAPRIPHASPLCDKSKTAINQMAVATLDITIASRQLQIQTQHQQQLNRPRPRPLLSRRSSTSTSTSTSSATSASE